MKLISRNWSNVYRSNPKDWTSTILEPCTRDELEALCRLMGIPHSGTKAHQIARLLDMSSLRIELVKWGEYRDKDYMKSHERVHEIAEAVSSRYKRKNLIEMAKRAKVFYSMPKIGIIIALLQWRERCRMNGKIFDTEIRRARKVQYVFPGFG